jgi:lantibiotic modifying enzyme
MFDDVSGEELLDAAVRGGDYLEHSVDHHGAFVYNYLPKTDEASSGYNILRHAGTAYSMLELHRAAPDAALLAAATRALDYLMARSDDCPGAPGETACIVEKGAVKLGGNALAVVALAELVRVTGDRRYLPNAQRLAAWIRSVQDEDGRFAVHKLAFPSGEIIPFDSGYYPGEALLALVRLYSIDKDEKWLDSAARGARYLIEVRDKGVPSSKLNHDHWLLYALNEIYRQRPEPVYLEHAMKIARAIVASQNRTPRYPDWLGSYYRPPRSTPTATRTEGLCAAYQLARDFRTAEEARSILEAMLLGVRFQLQTQFRPESVLYVEDPLRSLGGFHRSLTDFGVRIDYVQHNVSSLLCLRGVIEGTED